MHTVKLAVVFSKGVLFKMLHPNFGELTFHALG